MVEAKSGLTRSDAEKLVHIVRALRDSGVCEYEPTVRAPMMIGKTLKVIHGVVDARNESFRKLCLDILASETSRVGSKTQASKVKEMVSSLVDQHC